MTNPQSRAIWSWALFDFANSPFTTLVVTFVYATYFTQGIAADPILGTALWSRGVAITALVVAIASPLLGALADRGGYRKLFVVIAALTCAAATTALYSRLARTVAQKLGYAYPADVEKAIRRIASTLS